MFQFTTTATAALAAVLLSGTAAAQEPRDRGTVNDAAILAILDARNSAEVAAGRLALQHTKDPAVQRYAETLVREHGDALEKGKALAKRIGVTPMLPSNAPALSDSITRMHDQTIRDLAGKSGMEFDRAFLSYAVAVHERVLREVQSVMPVAQHAEVKQALQDKVPVLTRHREMAESLLRNR